MIGFHGKRPSALARQFKVGWGGRMRTSSGGATARRSAFALGRRGSFRTQTSDAGSAEVRQNSRTILRIAVSRHCGKETAAINRGSIPTFIWMRADDRDP